MRSVKYLVIIISAFIIFSVNVFAASGSLSVSSSTVYVGDSFTVSVNIKSAAAWNIHVAATGAVNNCSINEADTTSDAMDTDKTFSATCKATKEGTITIRLSGDVTSAVDGNAVNITGSKNITVITKPSKPDDNNPGGNNNKSNNNKIKELSVEGYDLTMIDANNYSLSVGNDVTSINVIAKPDDSKAKVFGEGIHNLSVGDNNIEVIVTSESGIENKIIIKIYRKIGFYLDDLDHLLENNDSNDINIIINSDTIITKEEQDRIKSSGKKVIFNYYANDNLPIYSWIIDGTIINNTKDLLTTIKYESDNKNTILRLSNYADGIIINSNQREGFTNKVLLRIYVGNKYSNDKLLNIYGYSESDDKLISVKRNVEIEDGYIEFEPSDYNDYYFTNFDLMTNKKDNSKIIIILILSLFSLCILLTIIYIIIRKRDKKDENNITEIIPNNEPNTIVEDTTINEIPNSSELAPIINNIHTEELSNNINNNITEIIPNNESNTIVENTTINEIPNSSELTPINNNIHTEELSSNINNNITEMIPNNEPNTIVEDNEIDILSNEKDKATINSILNDDNLQNTEKENATINSILNSYNEEK